MAYPDEPEDGPRNFVLVTLIFRGEGWAYQDLSEFLYHNEGFIFSRSAAAMSVMLFTETPVEELRAQVMTLIDPERDACSVDPVADPRILLPIAESLAGWLRIRSGG